MECYQKNTANKRQSSSTCTQRRPANDQASPRRMSLPYSLSVYNTPRETAVDNDAASAPKENVSHSSRQTASQDSCSEEPNDEITLNGMVVPKQPKIRFNTHLELTEAYYQRIKATDGYMPRIRSCWTTKERPISTEFRSSQEHCIQSQVRRAKRQRRKGSLSAVGSSPPYKEWRVAAMMSYPNDRKQTGLF